jgi:UDP-N-acetylmuramoyl-tripeptide--D-alanyl-D-alanine ligase
MVNMSKGIKNIITYGTVNGTVKGRVLNSASFLQVNISGDVIIDNLKTQLVGEYNLPNVLAAVTVGKYFSIPDEKIKIALENYTPSNSRSQLIRQGSNTIILDAYNANPSSMKAAIENFAKMEGETKILMLGGMMELGKDSKVEHANILKIIDEHKWHKVILVGDDFRDLKHNYIMINNSSELKEWFTNQTFENTLILIKGSRSIQMEKILE